MKGPVLLMPLDVQLFELTAGGLPEPRADWSETARTAILDGIRAEVEQRGRAIEMYRTIEGDRQRQHAQQQIIKLHDRMGGIILSHEYVPGQALPTKQGRFEWSLGPQAEVLRERGGPDCALFIVARRSYTSSGRVAVRIAGEIIYVAVPGGVGFAVASLVDVRTGDILWFNRLAQGEGDLRDGSGARRLAAELLSGLPR
jgi:hypothetical protein